MTIPTYDLAVRTDGIPYLRGTGTSEYPGSRIESPAQAAGMLRQCFKLHESAEERTWLLSLNAKCRPTAVSELAHGGYSCCPIDLRPLFTRALLAGASSILLAHNHPSGDPSPSRDDIEAARRTDEAGKLLGIPLADFLIIASGSHVSFRERGLIGDNKTEISGGSSR